MSTARLLGASGCGRGETSGTRGHDVISLREGCLKTALVIALLMLAGCTGREELLAREAAEDNQYCASLGINVGHPQHAQCRLLAAQIRAQREADQRAAMRQAGQQLL